MTEVPRLEAHDLEEELRPFLEADRKRHLLAVFGTGDEQVLRFSNAPEMRVIPVRSELELRAKMPPLTEDDPRLVFLVPWVDTLPIDLAGRFVRAGRVIRIGKEARLRRLFGVSEVDVDALKSPLAEWLLRSSERRYAIREGRLTHDAMWAAWLHQDWELDTEGGIALDSLLAWAMINGRGGSFRTLTEQAPAIEPALLDYLDRTLGPTGRLAFRCWREGRGAELLEHAVLFEVLAESSDPAVRMWVKQRLRSSFGVTEERTIAEVALALGRSAAPALRYVERRTDRAAVRALLRAAEERVDEIEVRTALAASLRLPLALEARREVFGDALLEAVKEPTPSAVANAEQLLRGIDGHTLASEGDNVRHAERAWMAVRLLAWLVARPDDAVPRGPAAYTAAEGLGQWYAEEGGYVDWARRIARGTAESRFGRGVQAIVGAADRARTELDRSFARALREWTVAGQPGGHVLGIDKAIERVAARFLDGSEERRLLIVLLDGMAWAQAVELLDSLFQDRAWGPLAWHTTKAGRIGDGAYPAMFAALPSVTEVSRSAFFAGKPVPPGRSEDTQRDRDRFRENKTLARFCRGMEVPTLLLRAENQTKGGVASEEALRLVGDTERRVVALVVNAIDDSLKGNPTTRHRWRVDSMKVLADVLEKARVSGRAVLLASDHGHVPSDLLEFKGSPMDGGARWRPLASETDPVHEFEVAFPAGRAWAPKGAWGVALMADDGGRWGSSTHSGEHGGATLAEVVAPCVIVGPEDLQGPVPDEALGIRPPYVPNWWHLIVQPTVVHEVVAVEVVENLAVERQQLLLPEIAPPPSVAPPPSSSKRPAPSPFARSKVLEARSTDAALRKEVVRAVDFLLGRNGVATSAAFAAEIGVLQRRVGGLVAKLQEVLNVDGYDVIRFEASDQQVMLDVGKLRMLFEVPE